MNTAAQLPLNDLSGLAYYPAQWNSPSSDGLRSISIYYRRII